MAGNKTLQWKLCSIYWFKLEGTGRSIKQIGPKTHTNTLSLRSD